MIKLDLSGLGIISGDQKVVLEKFIGSENFTQRKNYDEYYCFAQELEANISLSELMKLSERFKVEVLFDSVSLTEK